MTWPAVSLGELCSVASGGTPSRTRPSYYGSDIPWVKISDMLQGTITHTDEHITREGLANSSAKVFPKGTLLLSIFATVGRTAILGIDAATNQAIAGITPDSKRLDLVFLRHYLDASVPELIKQSRGVAQVNINLSILKSHPIPLPPLDEQRRIAAMLDKAEELHAKRRAAIAFLDQLPQAIFLEMFGDPTANPNGWPKTAQLADVSELVSGITKGRKVNGRAVREIPYLAVVNVQDRHLNLSAVKTIEATEDEIQRYRLRSGDLLLTEGGDPDKLGRGSLWNGELPEAIHQNHIFRVRVTSPALTPLYLSWLIGSSYGKAYFLRQAKQTTGIATINMGQLKAFPLLLPPLALQHQFAARVDAIHRAKVAHQAALAELDDLFASLQNRAFAGGLS